MAKQVSPGVLALRKVVDDVYADAREAKKQGKLGGWSSSKFPCELAEAFDLNVMYPENQAAGIAAQRDGEIMCQAAEDLGFDNDICGYARISLAYAAGKRASRKFDPETLEFIIDPNSGKPLKDENGNVVIDPETGKVSLVYKKDSENPWEIFKANYEVGQVVTAKIVSITSFGAFAQIIDGIDGLIHISQIANQRVDNVADILSVGQTVEAKITEIDLDKKRISLSMRALLPADAETDDED